MEEFERKNDQGKWRPTFAGNAANDHSQLNAEATVYLEGTSNREKDGDFML